MSPTMDLLTSTRLAWAAGIVLLTILIRFWQKLHYHRSLVKGLPGPPHSYLFGSLISMGKVVAQQPGSAAPQTYPTFIKEYYNLGDWFTFDPWPFGPATLVTFDPQMVHDFTVKNSMPKHPVVDDFMQNFGGEGNMVSSEGSQWKKWRSAFNPGFSAAYLMTLVPSIVDNCDVFSSLMLARAKTNELFRMEFATTNLTVDIIGKVVLDHDLNSQLRPNELVDSFISQTKWTPIGVQFNPIELIDIRMPIMLAWNNFKMNRYIGRLLDERFSTRTARNEATGGKRQKYVIDLALESYLKEAAGGDAAKEIAHMDPAFRTAAISNIKTFLFAGHDTTSSTICYAYYYLSKNPSMLARIRAEHDEVFGPDPSQTSSQLKTNAHLLNKLEYTTAVIKESLRLQPPASTVRVGQEDFFLHDPETGNPIPTADLMLWAVDVGLHRNPAHWTDPHTFDPERFLQKSSDGKPEAANPAYVPFSKGPRNCIGQELAMIESRIILALTMRLFDFSPAYDEIMALNGDGYGRGESAVEAGMKQFGDQAWQVQKGTAKPRGGMPCRLRVRE
jgi:cytochrome P450